MPTPYATYAFYARFPDAAPHPEQARIEAHLKAHHPALRQVASCEADLLIVLGGDGTILDAVRSRAPHRPHLLAMNVGHVGFLSTVRDQARFTDAIDRALEGSLVPLPIRRIRIALRKGSHLSSPRRRGSRNVESVFYAVNEALIDCTMTWIGLRLASVEGVVSEQIKSIKGSGICICSPIGSTSPLNVHLGAPTMDPRAKVFYVKGVHDAIPPIGGMLFPAEDGHALRLTLTDVYPNPGIPEEHRHPPALFLDGIRAAEVGIGDVIDISYDPEPSMLLRLPEDSHWDRVRDLRL